MRTYSTRITASAFTLGAAAVVDQLQPGLDQAKQGFDAIETRPANLPRGLYVHLNGVPTCMPFGVEVSALDRVEPVPGYPNHGRC